VPHLRSSLYESTHDFPVSGTRRLNKGGVTVAGVGVWICPTSKQMLDPMAIALSSRCD
jgi:hypothetical protein